MIILPTLHTQSYVQVYFIFVLFEGQTTSALYLYSFSYLPYHTIMVVESPRITLLLAFHCSQCHRFPRFAVPLHLNLRQNYFITKSISRTVMITTSTHQEKYEAATGETPYCFLQSHIDGKTSEHCRLQLMLLLKQAVLLYSMQLLKQEVEEALQVLL